MRLPCRGRVLLAALALVFLCPAVHAVADGVNFTAARMAVEDLRGTFGAAYPAGEDELAELRRAEAEAAALETAAAAGGPAAAAQLGKWRALARRLLLANPLLGFDRLLVIRRSEKHLGLVQNWESNSSLPMSGFDNEFAVLFPLDGGALEPLYRPERDVFAGDVDLHFNGDRLLFSMPGKNGRWQIHEMTLADRKAGELPLILEPDVDNYDACYLPDGDILFTSTAPFVGVPCVTGSSHVSNLYRFYRKTGEIRRLTFEQDHDWCPTLLNNGRVLYLRWEYSDIPHFVSRILFQMNPDGTGQMEYYGSNSYWPNAMFYARPVPGHPTMFCAIVGGHHDVPRMGELVLFDPARGRTEADGVVQRIPGRGGKVEPKILDGLVGASWPKFLHPFPLSDKYFIVSAKPAPDSLWGVYLVDVFDNMTLLKELPGQALLEPVPLRATTPPPVIPDRTHPERDDALVYLADVYAGPGLAGVPRDTVRQLRLFTYHFSYHGMGGQINRVGLDGPWDIKRVLGTVPVEPDGSAYFRVPANTPVSVQPLDGEGRALQLMRSWMTAMPGESLSCVGCHEKVSGSPPARNAMAARRAPSDITPWHGPTRGFSFRREVQPVLDRHCTACHDGVDPALPDFRDLPDVHTTAKDAPYNDGSQFPPAYLALKRHVRNATMESDMHLLTPLDFHGSTTELVQLLRGGHHGVSLDAESWDRINTWIDLNTPAHGTWHEIVGMEKVAHQRDRRMAMMAKHAPCVTDDPEAVPALAPLADVPAATPGRVAADPMITAETIPAAPPSPSPDIRRRRVDLGNGAAMELIQVPGGEGTPLWMGASEVTNGQYALFDPAHDSRLEGGDFLQFCVEERGWPLNGPEQPVVRVSWERAMEFCAWLSGRTGMKFTLPDEAQWERACRAGTDTPMWYGPVNADFSTLENLADSSFKAVETIEPWKLPAGAIHPWRPAVDGVNDGHRVSAPVASFQPNPWGFFDMHGNAAEWTLTPCGENGGDRVVRGGAWGDRPHRAASGFRRQYPPWQRIYNVGFRVACTDAGAGTVVQTAAVR